MASPQSVTCSTPSSATRKPAGVCIQLLADRIQKAEITVPSATMQAAKKCTGFDTRLAPNSMMPRKPASRKKAVKTS